MNQIILREKDWETLVCYLTARNDVESGAYALFNIVSCNGSNKLLVTQVLIPEDRDYLRRSTGAVAFRPEFTEQAFQQCEKRRGHLLDIHTHPWSTDVQFSHIDDREAHHTKVPYLRKYLPATMIAFIVFGESSVIAKARFWDIKANRLIDINRIMVI